MSREDSTRYVFMLVAAGGELLEIVQTMNSCWESLHNVIGELVTISIVEVEPEDFDFEGNHHDDM